MSSTVNISINKIENISLIIHAKQLDSVVSCCISYIWNIFWSKAVYLVHIRRLIVIIPELAFHSKAHSVPFIRINVTDILFILNTQADKVIGRINDGFIIISIHCSLIIKKIHPVCRITQLVGLTQIIILNNTVAYFCRKDCIHPNYCVRVIHFLKSNTRLCFLFYFHISKGNGFSSRVDTYWFEIIIYRICRCFKIAGILIHCCLIK